MKTNMASDTGVLRQLLAAVLLAATLASCKPFTPSPTAAPKIGGQNYGVECQPAKLDITHGETGVIKLAYVKGKKGVATGFKIGEITIVSTDPKDQQTKSAVTQKPDPKDGWSTIPGEIQVQSIEDIPIRTVTYNINILLRVPTIEDVNFWCQVIVHHVAPTPTPTPSRTPTPSHTPTPTERPPIIIITGAGFYITYTGPLEVSTGGTLPATFQVLTPDGLPATGNLTVMLRDSPSDPNPVHAGAELNAQGEVTIPLEISDYPVGTTLELNFSYQDAIYILAFEITVTP